MRVEVHPATADRFDDVRAALGGQACWCLYYRLSAGEYGKTTLEARPELMRERVNRSPAPGVVAYADGTPAPAVELWHHFRVRRAEVQPARRPDWPCHDSLPMARVSLVKLASRS
jgi:hypothetical protein